MNKRIEKISSYINENDLVADVGCDQALLSEVLAKRNIYSTASDIKKSIIKSAKERIENLSLDKYVNFIVSDGLEKINDDIDTLVLSGMGTYTILNIISKAKKHYKKIITISNNNHAMLRNKMLSFGYEVFCEEVIFERNKFYNLIVFKPGKAKYTDEELLLGKNHTNIDAFIEKMKFDLKKYNEIYRLSKNTNILNKIKIIERKLECR